MEQSKVLLITVSVEEWNETKRMIKSLYEKVSKLTDKEEKELLTPKEVCEMLKIGRTTFQRYVANGVLNPSKIDRRKYTKTYIKRSDIENLINSGELDGISI